MPLTPIQIFILICGFCSRLHTFDSQQRQYFVSEARNDTLTITAPRVKTAGTEFCWRWTSHDGRHINMSIVCANASDGQPLWTIKTDSFHLENISRLNVLKHFENAGEYTFVESKPSVDILAKFEVFVLKAYPPFGTFMSKNDSRLSFVQRGTDVTLRCEVSLLSESPTLQWERDRGQTSNTTLLYNNSAYIILHSVDEQSEGKYQCRLTGDGGVETVNIFTLNVTRYSQMKRHAIYRQSSNNSSLSLICKSKKVYPSLKWTWEPRPNSQIEMIAVEKGREVQVKGPIKLGRNSYTTYNGQDFIFHISPVKFNYSGTYKCIVNENTVYTAIIVHTIRVFGEPPRGVLRNQSVVLTCELSNVSDLVTLAWLRMEGNRGVLVKQQILTEKNKNITLTVSVNQTSLQTDSLHWQCAVFTENTLRALATVFFISPTTKNPETSLEISTLANQAKSKHVMITVASVLTLFAGILLGALLYYLYRKRMPGAILDVFSSTTICFEPQESEPVYINISQMRNGRENVKSSVLLVEGSKTLESREQRSEINHNLNKNRYGKVNMVRRDKTPVTSETVTYASINFNKSRFRTSPCVAKPSN
ncbi:uncharacterized protein LOC127447121 [Myxocyprinus asiaticus]|uniref:uncharacterized protein LOC127447121 n=1 Tax=Myxocyprinus asiaticus TaxID=70543 RepID=UPI002222FEE0|nr:uncharacterized protein LOC127447121 [Myxocyprinus asiaticus]